MSLQPVKRDNRFQSAIACAVNYKLEEEALAVPVWLFRNAHSDQAAACMKLLSDQGDDLAVRHHHRMLLRAYHELSRNGSVPTDGLLQAELMKLNCWNDSDAVGGVISPSVLAELEEQGNCALYLKTGETAVDYLQRFYIPELVELRRKRRVIHILENLTNEVENWNGPHAEDRICELIAELEVAYISGAATDQAPASPIGILVEDDLRDLEAQLAGEAEPKQIMTPFHKLNTITGGFEAGNLIILGGRTSMGKTAWSLDAAWFVANRGHLVLFYSLEMTKREITRRIAAKATNIPILKLRHGDLQNFHLGIYRRELGNREGIPFFVDDRPASPTEIEQRTEEILAMIGNAAQVGLICIDHLQLLRDQHRHQNRNTQLTQYMGELKNIAKRFNAPVLALSQLSRDSARDQRLPRLSDLRDSGSLEENADICLGLYRKSVDHESADPHEGTLVVLKNRSGPLAKLTLRWNGATATFKDPEAEGQEPEHEDAPF